MKPPKAEKAEIVYSEPIIARSAISIMFDENSKAGSREGSVYSKEKGRLPVCSDSRLLAWGGWSWAN